MSYPGDRNIIRAFASSCRIANLLLMLILTDRKHVAIAEGFGIDELDDKI